MQPHPTLLNPGSPFVASRVPCAARPLAIHNGSRLFLISPTKNSNAIAKPLPVRRRRPVGEGSRPEMVDEKVAADRQRKAGLTGLRAQNVRVEQAQVGPFVELALIGYAPQHFALDQQAKASETLRFHPFPFVRFAK